MPFNEPHPALIDAGILRIAYDKASDAIRIKPFELHWDDSLLTIAGSATHQINSNGSGSVWSLDFDGSGTKLGSRQFSVPPMAVDKFKIAGTYDASADSIVLDDFSVQAGPGQARSFRACFPGHLGRPRGRERYRLRHALDVREIRVACFRVQPDKGVDWPQRPRRGLSRAGPCRSTCPPPTSPRSARAARFPTRHRPSGLACRARRSTYIKGLPPIITKESTARVDGRHFTYDIPKDGRIDLPSGKSVSFSDGQFYVDDFRPDFPYGRHPFQERERCFKRSGTARSADL